MKKENEKQKNERQSHLINYVNSNDISWWIRKLFRKYTRVGKKIHTDTSEKKLL